MLLVNGDGTSLMLNIIDLVYQKNIRPAREKGCVIS